MTVLGTEACVHWVPESDWVSEKNNNSLNRRNCDVSQPFADTTAVVTGASSGIGRAISIAFARAGAKRIVIHYRRNQSGAQQTAELVKSYGCEPSLIAADIGVPEDANRLVQAAFDQLGVINSWVNNAGADVLTGDGKEWDFQTKLSRLLDVDVMGTVMLSRLVAKKMRDQASLSPPSMVFIGWDQSISGMEGDAGQMFGPVKAAVASFAASMAQEHASKIRINTVAPGWIRTSWGESTSEYWDRRAQEQSLMGRWGTPEDVAAAVAFVADPANTFIQGETINVSGGWNRRFEA